MKVEEGVGLMKLEGWRAESDGGGNEELLVLSRRVSSAGRQYLGRHMHRARIGAHSAGIAGCAFGILGPKKLEFAAVVTEDAPPSPPGGQLRQVKVTGGCLRICSKQWKPW
jgi:hypothetical protein